jgi:glycosyltransferase involved in cell wall biosynthesis
MNKGKVLLISSGQPSLNPRLVKEADTLAENGYNVTVLYSYWNSWGTKLDAALLPTKKWDAICIGGNPEQKPAVYFISRVIYKLGKFINRLTLGLLLTDIAISRTSYFLTRKAKKYKADLYIGHNLGALPATVKAAIANRSRCGFDAEDFHRNEVTNQKDDWEVILKSRVEQKYMPLVDYLSASSPLISAAYQHLFPGKIPVTLLNVFPANTKVPLPVVNPDAPLKLFWFSQTIGAGRGLEEAIGALSILKNYAFELHLLGYTDIAFKKTLADNLTDAPLSSIHFHHPIPSDEIMVFASRFDIGLAIETGSPLNRDICLTNKIFTYLQAGLCIVASDTKAQTQLINHYPLVGKIYRKADSQSLAHELLYYHQNRRILFETRQAALTLGKEELNWENESKKFLKVIAGTLNSNIE